MSRYLQPRSNDAIDVSTWANRIEAGSYPNQTIFVTDIGPSGTEFRSNGTRWVPSHARVLLGYMPLPCVIAPTLSSISAVGAFVLGTAVTTKYTKCYMYFAAGALYTASAAGFYYATMSSTTAGVVYNNTYTPAAGTLPIAPASPTAFADLSGGSLTGSTSEVTFFVQQVPGTILGAYGAMYSEALFEAASTAGAKNTYVYIGTDTATLGNNTMVGLQSLASASTCSGRHVIRNRATDAQRSAPNYQNTTTGSGTPYTASVDTESDFYLFYSLKHSGAATDVIGCSAMLITAEVPV
jgi:hypothetical protein